MLLECTSGRVVGIYPDGSEYVARAGAYLLPYSGDVGDLLRFGPAPPAGMPETRDYAVPTITPALLTALQGQFCADIDAQAQAIRDKYVTPGGSQAATYMFKQTQAVQAQAAQATTDAGKSAADLAALYPDLANEIGITLDPTTGVPATDVYGVMRAVLTTLQVWLPLNRTIEATRLKTKALINAATSTADAQAAHDGVAWPGA